jgi:hypothetical protein
MDLQNGRYSIWRVQSLCFHSTFISLHHNERYLTTSTYITVSGCFQRARQVMKITLGDVDVVEMDDGDADTEELLGCKNPRPL